MKQRIETILLTVLSVLVIGFLAGVIQSPFGGGESRNAQQNNIDVYTLQSIRNLEAKIDRLSTSYYGMFRMFRAEGGHIIRINTSTSDIAFLDVKNQTWVTIITGETEAKRPMDIRLGETNAYNNYDNEEWLEILEKIRF